MTDSVEPPVQASADGAGERVMELVRRLYPICRSITGDGTRQTLDILGEYVPLERHEIPSGTSVFDWEIPPEWNCRGARLTAPDGRVVVDFADHNLHVLNYSEPIDRVVTRSELASHVHTLPDHPDWIPYRTSYYRRDWGFCMPHRLWEGLPDGNYRAFIDSSLEPGALSLAEIVLPGRSEREVLFSTHVCHPSMCNDNLSGVAVQTLLFEWLADQDRHYTYRGVFVPGTIGALAWLWLRRRETAVPVQAGLVLAGLGDEGGFTFKRSRRDHSATERSVRAAARALQVSVEERPFSPYGYDERQYCSPGFDLPIGRFSRTPFGEYPEYHTSADDTGFVSADRLGESLACCRAFVEAMEADRHWVNTAPWGEPQLGRRGLYEDASGRPPGQAQRMALLWMLNLSDGHWSLLEIAERSGLSFRDLHEAAHRLADVGLLVARESAGADAGNGTRRA